MKSVLSRLTGHLTFPNIFIEGQSIGGSDNLASLHEKGELVSILENAGLSIQGNVGQAPQGT